MTDEVMPRGWRLQPLAELLSSMDSGSRPRGGVRGIATGVPSIGGEHINDEGGFDFESLRYVPRRFYESMRRGHVLPGDVLVVKDGATTGKVALVRDGFPFKEAVVNEHVFVLRPKSVRPDYLFWFLYSAEGQERVLEHFRGTAQGGINQAFARGTHIPLAPPKTQKTIAALLEDVDLRQRSARERLAAAGVALRRFRQAVVAAACSGRLTTSWRAKVDVESADSVLERRRLADRERLGDKYRDPALPDPVDLPEIPTSWCWAALPELGELGRGKSKHRPRNEPGLYGGRYPFIQTGDVARSAGRILTYSQTYNERGLAQSRLWPERTVCITIAANIADSALLTFPACFPDSVVGLIVDNSIAVPEYVELFMRTARRDLLAFAPATAQANINLAILSTLAVALPPVEEQREIVRRVEEIDATSAKVQAVIDAGRRRVEQTSQSILAKAFHGELSRAVTPSNDAEPDRVA